MALGGFRELEYQENGLGYVGMGNGCSWSNQSWSRDGVGALGNGMGSLYINQQQEIRTSILADRSVFQDSEA